MLMYYSLLICTITFLNSFWNIDMVKSGNKL